MKRLIAMRKKGFAKISAAFLFLASISGCGGGAGGSSSSPTPAAPGTFSVDIVWTPPANSYTNGDFLDSSTLSYNVYVSSSDGTNVVYNAGSVTNYTVSGLQSGQTYTLTVTSYDSSLTESDPSNALIKVF